MKKPAYGLNDAPRRWCNMLDSALRSYGLVPTRANCCTFVYYGKQLLKSTPINEKKSSNAFDLEGAVDFLTDPVSSTPRLHKFMELFLFMLMIFLWPVMTCLTRRSWDDFVRVSKLVPKRRMTAFSWGNASYGRMMTSTVGTLMFTRTLPLTNFRRLRSTRT